MHSQPSIASKTGLVITAGSTTEAEGVAERGGCGEALVPDESPGISDPISTASLPEGGVSAA